jgi:hypothetical protein
VLNKNTSTDRPKEKEKEGEQKKKKAREGTTITPKSAWKLPSGKSYGELFGDRTFLKNNAPKASKNGQTKAFCCKLFATGSCQHGDACRFIHTHPSKFDGKEKEMDGFYKKIYG